MLRCIILVEKIDLADMMKTKFGHISKQMNDDNLQIGEDTQRLLNTMMEDSMVPTTTKSIGRVLTVLLFYAEFVKTIIKKFLFKSSLWSDLRILNLEERTTYSDFSNLVIPLTNHLPHLKLDEKLDVLKSDAVDFKWQMRPISLRT